MVFEKEIQITVRVREVDEQIAEEARILYVALTRSIRNCIWINNIDSTPQISWGSLLEG